MQTFQYTIRDAHGIHARPAGLLVKTATSFASTIAVAKEKKTADAKKLLAIMTLGVKSGDTITITADGTDEVEAVEAIRAFLTQTL